jgi:hypothetical protein
VVRMKGHWWMIRRYGLRRWWCYCRQRRSGVLIDYAQILTDDERAILAEHTDVAPWER